MARGFLCFGSGPWDPTHRFHTSWLLGPWALFFCRALISLWAFTTIFFIIGWTCAHPASLGGCPEARRSFSYFTILAYWGQAFYFFFAAVHTLVYALTSRPLLARLPRPLQALHSLFYSSVVTLPVIVTVVYWAVLYRSPWFPLVFDAWRNLSEHALNSGLALFEILVPRTNPLPWIHLPWLVLCLLGYLAVAYITVADQGFYTYNFLDHDKVGGRGYVAAYVFGIAIGLVVVFSAVHGLILLRRWLTESKLGMKGKFAGLPTMTTTDAEMNVVEPGESRSKEAKPLTSPAQM
ncbi:hypothetical protein HRG_001227 [Hirsutella rhossiliensis]|uniref:Alpha beta hydrolase fold-1 protein n=1 Tax=Hirsutella rhossiliensis TaxID=111463 RepID=A0A9P8SP55_9HYPO|nr:putative alpha beta hydrolase fold-1 protein [Hirsutella rhossiliensis]KAH0968585.1 putative alpha beta hydrolase fold-1 protein [Hirsutella rhossiliensis]